MKVLLLSGSENDPNAGASRIYHFLNDGLAASGHFVRTLHYEDFSPVGIPGVRRVIDRLLLPQFMAFRMRSEARSGYDVIMTSNGGGCSLFPRLRRHSVRPVLVNHIHGLNLFDYQADLVERLAGRQHLSLVNRLVTAPLMTAWDAKGSRYADITIVQNDRDFDFFLRSGQPYGQLIRIAPAVHPAIMTASSTVAPPEKRAPASLLWFGSWESRKGKNVLPTAFGLILEKIPEATLTIGGTGARASEVLRSFSAWQAERVRVLPRISVDRQIEIFGQHAIFLFPSLSEGYGLALVEGMALGLAAITTNTGVGGDSLCHRETALIIPASSAVHLAQAVVTLVHDDALRCDIARNGQALARTISVDKMVTGYEQAFENALRDRAATTPMHDVDNTTLHRNEEAAE